MRSNCVEPAKRVMNTLRTCTEASAPHVSAWAHRVERVTPVPRRLVSGARQAEVDKAQF